jgi:hypothetical protein
MQETTRSEDEADNETRNSSKIDNEKLTNLSPLPCLPQWHNSYNEATANIRRTLLGLPVTTKTSSVQALNSNETGRPCCTKHETSSPSFGFHIKQESLGCMRWGHTTGGKSWSTGDVGGGFKHLSQTGFFIIYYNLWFL